VLFIVCKGYKKGGPVKDKLKAAVKKWLKDGIVLIPIVGHWALSLLTRFLPAIVAESISKLIFKITLNEYRYAEFLKFWNKKP